MDSFEALADAQHDSMANTINGAFNVLTALAVAENEGTPPGEPITISNDQLNRILIDMLEQLGQIDKDSDDKLKDMKKVIIKDQLDALREYRRAHQDDLHYQGSERAGQHRTEFGSVLPRLRREWSEKTGKPWPMRDTGRKKDGQPIMEHQPAHEIYPNSYDSPLQWWNIYPAPAEQHRAIHGRGTPHQRMFPDASPFNENN